MAGLNLSKILRMYPADLRIPPNPYPGLQIIPNEHLPEDVILFGDVVERIGKDVSLHMTANGEWYLMANNPSAPGDIVKTDKMKELVKSSMEEFQQRMVVSKVVGISDYQKLRVLGEQCEEALWRVYNVWAHDYIEKQKQDARTIDGLRVQVEDLNRCIDRLKDDKEAMTEQNQHLARNADAEEAAANRLLEKVRQLESEIVELKARLANRQLPVALARHQSYAKGFEDGYKCHEHEMVDQAVDEAELGGLHDARWATEAAVAVNISELHPDATGPKRGSTVNTGTPYKCLNCGVKDVRYHWDEGQVRCGSCGEMALDRQRQLNRLHENVVQRWMIYDGASTVKADTSRERRKFYEAYIKLMEFPRTGLENSED